MRCESVLPGERPAPFPRKKTKSASAWGMSFTRIWKQTPKCEVELRRPTLPGYAAFSSRMAAFTLATRSAGIGSMPCSVRAWSAHCFRTSRSVSPRASKSQSTPTSLHLTTLDILLLQSASMTQQANTDGWRGREACCQRHSEITLHKRQPFFLFSKRRPSGGFCAWTRRRTGAWSLHSASRMNRALSGELKIGPRPKPQDLVLNYSKPASFTTTKRSLS